MMARDLKHFELRVISSIWAKPVYLASLAYVWTVAPFLGDEALEALIDRCAQRCSRLQCKRVEWF